jgi:hypothetical protein
MERSLPVVYVRMMRLKALPESAFTDSSINSMPNKKIPSPARSFQRFKADGILK